MIFLQTNEDLLSTMVKFFHYSKALHHVFFEMQSGICYEDMTFHTLSDMELFIHDFLEGEKLSNFFHF
jgi:hypothetical protein